MRNFLYLLMALLSGALLAWVVFACGKDRNLAPISNPTAADRGPLPNGCDCEYRIISFHITKTEPGYGDYTEPYYGFNTTNNNSTYCYGGCQLVDCRQAPFGECQAMDVCTFNLPQVVDPDHWYPFNCVAQWATPFDLTVFGKAVNLNVADHCEKTDQIDWTMTYEIRCRNVHPPILGNDPCWNDPWHYSGVITASAKAGSALDFWNVSFEGSCGCTPKLTDI